MDNDKIKAQTRENYNSIAGHFAGKRSIDKGWFDWILLYVQEKDKVADLGCGNGRLYGYLRQNYRKINYTGIDFSQKLIEIAKKTYPQTNFKVSDITDEKTYRDLKNIDTVFSFRAIHHFPDKHQEFFQNCFKILKKNGFLVLEVWNLWQERFWLAHLRQLRFKTLYVPYTAGQITVNRFHYCFTKGGLVKLAKNAGFKVLEAGVKNKGQNIYLVGQKC